MRSTERRHPVFFSRVMQRLAPIIPPLRITVENRRLRSEPDGECKGEWVLKNSFQGISITKFVRKLLNVRSPQTLEFAEITALVPFSTPTRYFNTIQGTPRRAVRKLSIALPDSVLPPTQCSVNLVRGKVFRSKILTYPLTDVTVLRVTRCLKCFKKLSKTGRSSAVLGRTSSLSRHTNLLERFVSEQNLFKKKLVLPAVAKIVFV